MRFSQDEIKLSKRFRENGLSWEPRAGHYVYDETGFCQQTSPFQPQVYFILNYDYFMKAVGGVERFQEIMIWLPTWDDIRELLRSHGVSDHKVADYLREHQAIEHRRERLALYELLDSMMTK